MYAAIGAYHIPTLLGGGSSLSIGGSSFQAQKPSSYPSLVRPRCMAVVVAGLLLTCIGAFGISLGTLALCFVFGARSPSDEPVIEK